MITIFLHVPKAGGSTLYRVLDRQYGSNHVYYKMGKKTFDFSYFHDDHKEKNIKLIRGHVNYGVHQRLALESFQYITFLRDPIDRVISYYFFIKARPRHPEYQLIKNDSLLEFVQRKDLPELSNGQTRRIAGEMFPLDERSETYLDIAYENIEKHFGYVGIVEYYVESLLLMKQNLGWNKHILFVKENSNRSRNDYSDLKATVEPIISERNQLDLMFYEEMKRRLELDITQNLSANRIRLHKQANAAFSQLVHWKRCLLDPKR